MEKERQDGEKHSRHPEEYEGSNGGFKGEVGVHTGGTTRLAFGGKVLETSTLFAIQRPHRHIRSVASACHSLLTSGVKSELRLHLSNRAAIREYYGCSANNRHLLSPVLEAGIQCPGVGRTGPSEASPLGLWMDISCLCPCVAAPCVWVSVS